MKNFVLPLFILPLILPLLLLLASCIELGDSISLKQETTAEFNSPHGITLGPDGNFYIADYESHRIRKITPLGRVSTFAGSTVGTADGNGAEAQFNKPIGIAVDPKGNFYVADYGNNRIRKITPSGMVSTLAGKTYGFADDGTEGVEAKFKGPIGIAVGPKGNIYVADYGNNRIRKITPEGSVSTLAGSTRGSADAEGEAAQFSSPIGIIVGPKGNIYVADRDNSRIRKITPSGTVSTFAGSTRGSVDGQGIAAQFVSPNGITMASDGNIYVVDYDANLLRKISPGGNVSTIVRNLSRPYDLVLTPDGVTAYITDRRRIVRVRFR